MAEKLDFTREAAEQWKNDSDKTLKDIGEHLSELHDEIKDPLGEDTWMKAMVTIAEKEQSAWNGLVNVFNVVSKGVADAFNGISTSVQQQKESLDAYSNRHF